MDHRQLIDILSHRSSAKKYYYDFLKPSSVEDFLVKLQEKFRLESLIKNTRLKKHKDYVSQYKDGQVYATEYYRIFDSFFEELIRFYQEKAQTSPDALVEHLKSDFSTQKISTDFRAGNSVPGSIHFISFIKKLVASISFQNFTYKQKFQTWEQLSRLSPNYRVDEFFREHLLEEVHEEPYLGIVEEAMRLGRVQSDRLGAELLEVLLSKDVNDLKNKAEISNKDIRTLLVRLQTLLPSPSPYRDKILDDISWSLSLNSFQARAYIEPAKSFNWKLIPPEFLKRLSFLDRIMPVMTTKEKRALLSHIRNPEQSLWDKLPRLKGILEKASESPRLLGGERPKQIMDNVDKILFNANFSGRVALIQQVLGSATAGLWWQNIVEQKNIISDLNIQDGSFQKTLLMAYLKAAPKNEKTITLSYLLASEPTSKNQSIDLVKVLELFPPFGVKFGQIASILNLFGREHSEKLMKLKDMSSRPSVTEAYEIIKKVLPQDVYENIKIKSVLGIASLKVVFLIERTLPDGTIIEEALLVKQLFTEERLASSLSVIRKAASELYKDPDFSKNYDIDYLMGLLETSVYSELDFTLEVKNFETIRPFYQGKEINGWRFEVPWISKDLINKDYFSMQPIKRAVPFRKLSSADQKVVSQLILETELSLLFEKGVFDADRHTGNYLIDPETKKVFVIDPGQVYELSTGSVFKEGHLSKIGLMFLGLDPRQPSYEIFLDGFTALVTNRKKTLLQQVVTRFGFGRYIDTNSQDNLKAQLLEDAEMKDGFFNIINNTNNSVFDKIVEVVELFGSRKIYLPQEIIFGFMKSLIILSNEEYARSTESQKYILEYIEGFVSRKTRHNILNGALSYSEAKRNYKGTDETSKTDSSFGYGRCSDFF